MPDFVFAVEKLLEFDEVEQEAIAYLLSILSRPLSTFTDHVHFHVELGPVDGEV